MEDPQRFGLRPLNATALDPFLRGLLLDDCVVTRALRDHASAEVKVSVEEQAHAPRPRSLRPYWRSEPACARCAKVAISVGQSAAPALLAESFVVPDRLPAGFLSSLETSAEGIGVMLENLRALSRMNSLSPDTTSDTSLASKAFEAALEVVAGVAPEVSTAIRSELEEQRHALKLIASENYSSLAVQLAMGQWMTDKYAEGATGKRWYAGCENVDTVEGAAASLAQELFGADHAYVQPHSGADANLVAFSAILAERVEKPFLEEQGVRDTRLLSAEQWEALRQRLVNQRMLAMELTSGGHLTHGMRANLSAKLFEVVPYGVDPESGLLDYDRVRELALETRPLLILAGHSSYPRKIDFRRFREIADEVGAVFMVDMAHFAGLVAGGVFQDEFDPVPYADVVTSTTHKTLRGPRGGLVLCTSEFADAVDRGCPMILGGPLAHVMAAKAVAFHEALAPSFRDYAAAIVANARALAEALVAGGEVLQTGGTDNHLLLVDVRPHGLNGRQAEAALRQCDIVLNRNVLPYDPNGPWFTSGIRLGTAALTTRGLGEEEMGQIAGLITAVLGAVAPIEDDRGEPVLPDALVDEVRAAVEELTAAYPLYPDLVV